MSDDPSLLRRYSETRAEDAFAELVHRHLDGVYSAALRRVNGDTHLAEDVAQQVFSALAQNAGSLSRHPILAGWLYRTTRNQAANAVRTERRRKAREQEAQDMTKLTSEPAVEADWSCVAPVLDDVFDELNESDRTAVLLRFVERRPFAEIGFALRLTEDAARMRIDRAVDKLRIQLRRRGILSSSAALGAALANNAVSVAPIGLAKSITGAALAAGSSILGPATTTVQIMSMIKSATGGLTLALIIAALGTATYELREARQLRASLQNANSEIVAFAGQLQALEKDESAAEQNPAGVQTAAESQGNPAVQESDAQKFLETFPQARDAILEGERGQVKRTYSLFFKSAGLTGDQINQFENAVMENSLHNMAISPQGDFSLNTSPPPADQLSTILGAQAYQQYQDYNRAMPAQNVAIQVATESAYASAPLTLDQVNQLAQIVADNSASYHNGNNVNLDEVDWGSVLTQAAAIGLSPAQTQKLQSGVQKVRYQTALLQALQTQTSAPAE
jgi:RNA polymerase sigma factor (sigma-70 family)